MPANPRVCCLVGLSATGRIGLGNLQHGETALVDLDGDADGLYDPWEQAFGLDSSDPDDVAADDDERRPSSTPTSSGCARIHSGVTSAPSPRA